MTAPQQAPNVVTITAPIPNFEGAPVSSTSIRISGRSQVDAAEDVVISTDDRVRLVGEYRVVSVRHFVDEKTGDLVREQVLKPLTIQLCPFDPSNPDDDGIVRAR